MEKTNNSSKSFMNRTKNFFSFGKPVNSSTNSTSGTNSSNSIKPKSFINKTKNFFSFSKSGNSSTNNVVKNVIVNKQVNQSTNELQKKMVGILGSIKEKMNTKRIIIAIISLILLCLFLYVIISYVYFSQKECYEKKGFFEYLFNFDSSEVCIMEKAPLKPKPLPKEVPRTPLFSDKKEVYHIANQNYTFEQSKCKCESYGGRLATKSELIDAYNNGANWCSYGWSEGQNAYYPTQQCEYDKITEENKRLPKSQQKNCGLPGLNGGHFTNPNLKFGINCYGVKPKGSIHNLKKPYCPPMNFCKLENNYDANNKLDSDEVMGFNNEKWNM
jgi:hypothetical protein